MPAHRDDRRAQISISTPSVPGHSHAGATPAFVLNEMMTGDPRRPDEIQLAQGRQFALKRNLCWATHIVCLNRAFDTVVSGNILQNEPRRRFPPSVFVRRFEANPSPSSSTASGAWSMYCIAPSCTRNPDRHDRKVDNLADGKQDVLAQGPCHRNGGQKQPHGVFAWQAQGGVQKGCMQAANPGLQRNATFFQWSLRGCQWSQKHLHQGVHRDAGRTAPAQAAVCDMLRACSTATNGPLDRFFPILPCSYLRVRHGRYVRHQ